MSSGSLHPAAVIVECNIEVAANQNNKVTRDNIWLLDPYQRYFARCNNEKVADNYRELISGRDNFSKPKQTHSFSFPRHENESTDSLASISSNSNGPLTPDGVGLLPPSTYFYENNQQMFFHEPTVKHNNNRKILPFSNPTKKRKGPLKVLLSIDSELAANTK